MDTTNGGRFSIASSTALGTTDRFVIDGSGNVGIGSTDPLSKLHILSGTQSATGEQDDGQEVIEGANLTGSSANLSLMSNTAWGVDLGGSIGFAGRYRSVGTDGATFSKIKGGKENSTDGNYSGYLQFLTVTSGGANTEKMRITSGGNVGIGISTPGGILQVKQATNINFHVGPAVALSGAVTISGVNDAVSANIPLEIRSSNTGFSGANVGFQNLAAATANHLCYDTVTMTGFNTVSTCSSLRALKMNIKDILSAKAESDIMKLKPVSFQNKKTKEKQYGLLADDVNKVDPVLSTFYKGALNGVDYDGIVSLLVKTVQDQNKRIEQLEEKLSKQK